MKKFISVIVAFIIIVMSVPTSVTVFATEQTAKTVETLVEKTINVVETLKEDMFESSNKLQIKNSVSSDEEGEWLYVDEIEGGKICFDSSTGTITDSEKTIISANIPSTINGVSVETIDDYTFADCENLEEIILPDSITSLGDRTFANTPKLKEINYPLNLTNEDSPFLDSSIEAIIIPDGVVNIPRNIFRGTIKLESIVIPNSVETIGSEAFSGCTGLTSVTMGDSVISIGDEAFSDCEILEEITLPNSIIRLGYKIFSNTPKLKEVNYPLNLKDCMRDSSWEYYGPFGNSSIETITMPDGVVNIPCYAFSSATKLVNVTIPDSVETIDSYAFFKCTSLTSIKISDSVTSIGEYAFYNCTNLISIKIPNSVVSIGEYAFSNCYVLSSIVIPDSVTSIGEYAFSNCDFLTSITIGNSVQSIDSGVFSSCYGLTSITIGDSVKSINSDAFADCYSLTSITIPNSVTSIGNGAFHYCNKLTSITIPNSVESIGFEAFEACTSLTSITIGNSVTNIGEYAFCACTSLISITIPDSVISINDDVFSGCNSLISINVSDNNNYYSSENGVLYNKDKTEIIFYPNGKEDNVFIIPNSVTSINDYSFYNCTNLTSITIGNSVISMGDNAFFCCENLTSITIPDSVINIGYYAFSNCSSLTSIALPCSVTSIGLYAFSSCDSLTNVYYSESKEQWEDITIDRGNEDLINANIDFNIGWSDNVLKMEIQIYDSYEFPVCLLPEYMRSNFLTFISSNKDIVSCENTVFYGERPGTAVITIKSPQGQSVLCYVSVSGELFWSEDSSESSSSSNSNNFNFNSENFNFGSAKDTSTTLKGPNINFGGKEFSLFEFGLDLDMSSLNELMNCETNYDFKTQTAKVTIGIEQPEYKDDDKDTPESSYWEETYYEIKEAMNFFGKSTDKQFYNKFRSLRKDMKKMNLKLGFDFDASAMGYLEFDCASGLPMFKEGAMIVELSLNADVTYPLPPAPVVYVKVGIEADATGKLVFKVVDVMDLRKGIDVNASLNMQIKPYVELGGDVGIANASARLKGILDTTLKMPFSSIEELLTVVLRAELQLKYEALFFFSGESTLDIAEAQIFPKPKNSFGFDESLIKVEQKDESQYKLMPRTSSYISPKPVYTPNALPTDYNSENIADNIFQNVAPSMVTMKNGQAMTVWEIDDLSRSSENRTNLMYSIFDGENWSSAKAVNDDGTCDFEPKLFNYKNETYLVWKNSNKVQENGSTLGNVLESVKINIAKYDGQNFVDIQTLTDENNNYPVAVDVAVSDTSYTITWVENTQNDIYGTAGENVINTITFEDGAFSSQSNVVSTTLNIVGLSTIYNNNSLVIAYMENEYLNGDLKSNNLKVIENGTTKTVDTVVVNKGDLKVNVVNNQVNVLWSEGSTLHIYNCTTEQTQEIVLEDIYCTSDLQWIVNDNGDEALLYTYVNDYESELKVRYKQNGEWSESILLTEDKRDIKSFVSEITSSGDLKITFASTEVITDKEDPMYPYGQSQLKYLQIGDEVDIEIVDEPFFNPGKVTKGENLEIDVQIKNNSKKALTSVNVNINETGNVEYAVDVQPGQTQSLTINYLVDENLIQEQVSIDVTPVAESDSNLNNNSATLNVYLFDLEVVSFEKQDDYAVAVLRNNSEIDVQDVNVDLIDDSMQGDIIESKKVSINSNEEIEVRFQLPADKSETDVVYYYIDIASEKQENVYLNNYMKLVLKPIVVETITLNQEQLNLNVNDIATLSATLNPTNAPNKDVTWVSSDENIVTVVDGKVTAVKEGTARITVISNDSAVMAHCEVTVSASSMEFAMKFNSTFAYKNGVVEKTTGSNNDGQGTYYAQLRLRGNSVILPLRYVAESVGLEVGYDQYTGLTTITDGSTIVKIIPDSSEIIVVKNGETSTFDIGTVAETFHQVSHIPVRGVLTQFGLTVKYDYSGYIIVTNYELTDTQKNTILEKVKNELSAY